MNIAMNEKRRRFEIKTGSEWAYLDYRWYKGDLALMHTFVPKEEREKGIGAALAKFALEYARKEKLKIMPYCPYVSKYIQEHPEYKDLVDAQYFK
jgi:predicted GNAT family acetyltransferase